MRVYTYSDARQNLSDVLALAEHEEVVIKRRDGATFSVVAKPAVKGSPFDVPSIKTKASTANILEAIRESREH